MIIRPARALKGRIELPGDKSISHRAAMLAAMAEGTSRIENFATSADCAATLGCLRDLGVEIEHSGSNLSITGVGRNGFTAPKRPLDCGNSGTTMRLLTGILAGQKFASVLTGDQSLTKRPMMRVITPLQLMGAAIDSTDGRAPLKISGNGLQAIHYRLPVASAQIKSCIMLAGLHAEGSTTVIEPLPTRDHTERMLRFFGVALDETETSDGKRISVSGNASLAAQDLFVPSDVSSAAFFMAAASALEDSEIEIPNVGLNPTRAAVIEVLVRLGCRISIRNEHTASNEPVGTIRVRGGLNPPHGERSNIIDGRLIPNLIDEIPVLAVFATRLEKGLEVRDAAELRVKESDRIAAVVENLTRMGAVVTEFPDGFRIEGSRLKGSQVNSFGDHRIAMAFAVAGLLAKGETEIVGAECAAVSFPAFYETLASARVE
ncbi:MAG: 3-phosphoshikimate 1-carboxyvinyltransferase [Acidobacteria bacterium]|nr:3-phosphoshikimate 1-carboxyvinyltransferase [Acidobacteriota bacterium]